MSDASDASAAPAAAAAAALVAPAAAAPAAATSATQPPHAWWIRCEVFGMRITGREFDHGHVGNPHNDVGLELVAGMAGFRLDFLGLAISDRVWIDNPERLYQRTCGSVYANQSRDWLRRVAAEWVANLSAQERLEVLVLALKQPIDADRQTVNYRMVASLALALLEVELGVGTVRDFANLAAKLMKRSSPLTHVKEDRTFREMNAVAASYPLDCSKCRGKSFDECSHKEQHEREQLQLLEREQEVVNAQWAETPRRPLPYTRAIAPDEIEVVKNKAARLREELMRQTPGDDELGDQMYALQVLRGRMPAELSEVGQAAFDIYVASMQQFLPVICYHKVQLSDPALTMGLVRDPTSVRVGVHLMPLLMLAYSLEERTAGLSRFHRAAVKVMVEKAHERKGQYHANLSDRDGLPEGFKVALRQVEASAQDLVVALRGGKRGAAGAAEELAPTGAAGEVEERAPTGEKEGRRLRRCNRTK